MFEDVVIPLIVSVSVPVFFVVAFIVLRQLVLWYFRLNQIADDIAVIANYYRSQLQASAAPTTPPPSGLQSAPGSPLSPFARP